MAGFGVCACDTTMHVINNVCTGAPSSTTATQQSGTKSFTYADWQGNPSTSHLPAQICNTVPNESLPKHIFASLLLRGAVLMPKEPLALLRDEDEVELRVEPDDVDAEPSAWGLRVNLVSPSSNKTQMDAANGVPSASDDSSAEATVPAQAPPPDPRPSRSARRKALKRRLIREVRCACCGLFDVWSISHNRFDHTTNPTTQSISITS